MQRNIVVTTSWDDGHPLDLRVANLLSAHGLTGTFYAPLEFQGDVVAPAQIREISKCFEIGAHTSHHADLTSIPDWMARKEIFESKLRLEEITGLPCSMFCFPKGRFAREHLGMVRQAGFLGARTVELLSLDSPSIRDGLALVPTTIQAYPHPRIAYWKNCGLRANAASLLRLTQLGRRKGWEAVALSMLEEAQKCGGVFHLWGHSWEIEATGQWDALDRILGAMGQVARRARCVTNSQVCEYAN